MMKMPKVIECMMVDCTYNDDRCCHALAITVGGPEPLCDTFMQADFKGGDRGCSGCVGACKVEACRHNLSLECAAEGIQVEPAGAQPKCMTFKAL
jgi:hypothetical protein